MPISEPCSSKYKWFVFSHKDCAYALAHLFPTQSHSLQWITLTLGINVSLTWITNTCTLTACAALRQDTRFWMLCQKAKYHPILPSLGDHLFLFNVFCLTSIISWWWSQSVSEASWNNTPCGKLWCPVVLHIYPNYIKHYIKQSEFQTFSLDIVSMLCQYLWDQKHAKVLNPSFWIETLCFTQDWALRILLPSPQHATAWTLNVTKNVTTVTSLE